MTDPVITGNAHIRCDFNGDAETVYPIYTLVGEEYIAEGPELQDGVTGTMRWNGERIGFIDTGYSPAAGSYLTGDGRWTLATAVG